MHIVIDRSPTNGTLRFTETDEALGPAAVHELDQEQARNYLLQAERDRRPRWVFASTPSLYPRLLDLGIRLSRAHDLTLCRAILRRSPFTRESPLRRHPPDNWDEHTSDTSGEGDGMLAGLSSLAPDAPDTDQMLEELQRQQSAVAGSQQPHRLRLLLAAESCGALIACEMRRSGLPWRRDIHEGILTRALGPRPVFGGRPARLEALAERIRALLEAPTLNPDSAVDLLRALQHAGLPVRSTSKGELRDIPHPVVEPLLEYKSLARLMTANGWAWLDEWVHHDRFRPEYVVGGVATGRWATDGGGAMQLPHTLRPAVVADEGWTLVVADAAQLEPRIVAAMSGDRAMGAAGRDRDLYQGLVDAGTVDTRAHAKVAMLGALYGATTGESARLMPRLRRDYPRSVGLVEAAARAGERGEQVGTWLGRGSPDPGSEWRSRVEAGARDGASPTERRAGVSAARDWSRFTRNFVAQGTAAEWAMCWMAELRHRLRVLAAGTVPDDAAQLVYFLHDEVIVHTPLAHAEDVARAVRDAAGAAARDLFGTPCIDFPLDVHITRDYSTAKG